MIVRRRYEFERDLFQILGEGLMCGALTVGPAPEIRADMLADAFTDSSGDRPIVRLTGSGRRALLQLLETSGIGPGAKIMLPAYTFAGVAQALETAGY